MQYLTDKGMIRRICWKQPWQTEIPEDSVADGFYMEVYSEADGSFQTFDMLVVKNGGRVSFYMDSIELCAAVDTSHEEIQSMIADMEGAVID